MKLIPDDFRIPWKTEAFVSNCKYCFYKVKVKGKILHMWHLFIDKWEMQNCEKT